MRVIVFVATILLLALTACGSESAGEASPTPSLSPTPGPTATPTPAPTPAVTLSIDGPTEVKTGSEFTVKVAIPPVANIAFYQFDLTYDPSLVEVAGEQGGPSGVSNGMIGGTDTMVDWAFVPSGEQGSVRVLGETEDIEGASGSGYLAEIHFEVVALTPGTSPLTLSNVLLLDGTPEELGPVAVQPGMVIVLR